MKKLISLLLCLSFVFAFSSCKESEVENVYSTLEHYATLGRMPEAAFALGADIETSNSELSKAAEQDENKFYDFAEGTTTGYFTDGDFEYFYSLDNTGAGIGYVVSYSTAFGFPTGTVITEIEAAIKGSDYQKTELSADDVFFLMGVSEGTVIKCKFEKCTISFIFIDNVLCASTIYHNDWK